MLSERPVAEYGVHGEQRHGYEPDEEVGHGQAEQEVVADVLQLLVDLERHHDHYVAGHGDEAQHAGHQRYEHGLRHREPGGVGAAGSGSRRRRRFRDVAECRRSSRRRRCPRIVARRLGR